MHKSRCRRLGASPPSIWAELTLSLSRSPPPQVKELSEAVEVNTDANAWPTPNQIFHHLWPFFAGTLGMMFESVACKFSKTDDFKWLCTEAMNDDTKAAVALCLLVAPAEHSPAFVRAVCAHGTMPRIKEIVQIYKTLPRDQHDDLLVVRAARLRRDDNPDDNPPPSRVALPTPRAHCRSSYV